MSGFLAAVITWKRGEEIDAELWFRLAARGYDMDALRKQHLK